MRLVLQKPKQIRQLYSERNALELLKRFSKESGGFSIVCLKSLYVEFVLGLCAYVV